MKYAMQIRLCGSASKIYLTKKKTLVCIFYFWSFWFDTYPVVSKRVTMITRNITFVFFLFATWQHLKVCEKNCGLFPKWLLSINYLLDFIFILFESCQNLNFHFIINWSLQTFSKCRHFIVLCVMWITMVSVRSFHKMEESWLSVKQFYKCNTSLACRLSRFILVPIRNN